MLVIWPQRPFEGKIAFNGSSMSNSEVQKRERRYLISKDELLREGVERVGVKVGLLWDGLRAEDSR